MGCLICGASLRLMRQGTKTCSPAHRKALSRRTSAIPAVLTSMDRWIRRNRAKVPLTVDGRPASSTNSATWSSFSEANDSRVGAGLGFVLDGDGIGCYDLDHCLVDGKPNEAAATFIAAHPEAFYIERSPSGDGLHLWVPAESRPGWKRKIDGLNVEFYTRGRYITITGLPL